MVLRAVTQEMSGLKGVNLGGWLVLERWMTPSLFKGTDAQDEYTFMATPDAAQKVREHRQSFITEDDFAWLRDNGIEAVRLPVGYWALGGGDPYIDATETLDGAFALAQKYGLKVLLDLHGLPGSQNGNDHSGRIGNAGWQGSEEHLARSLRALEGLACRYGGHPALWGLQVINEPNAAALQLFLRRYYRQAYALLARILPEPVRIVYSDAWSPRLLAFTLAFRRRAVMDVHVYHMATLGASKHPLSWFYRKMRRRGAMLRRLSLVRPVIIGEWSGVIGHETYAAYPDLKEGVVFREFVRLQDELYAPLAGSFYWNYKTEEPSQWNYRARREAGDL